MDVLNIYTDTLYLPSQAPQSTDITGGFAQKVAILVKKDDVMEANLSLLKKIMNSCNMSEADYYLYTVPNDEVPLAVQKTLEHLRPHKLIVFGLPLLTDTMKQVLEIYKLKRMHGVEVLLSHSLTDLSAQASYKNYLWRELKKMFGI